MLTPAVNITLFQTKPNATAVKQEAESAYHKPTVKKTPSLSDSKPRAGKVRGNKIRPNKIRSNKITAPIATSVKTTSPKAELHPSNTPSVSTTELLKEAIDLHTPNTSSNTFADPETSKMFDSRLEKQLKTLRKERQRLTKDSARLKKHASTTDPHGDLRARADNGCIFRRDDSGGLLDGTWYAEGCKKEETISLTLPEALKVPKPSFRIK